MKDQRFIGTGVAIITPFRNNEIDFTCFWQHHRLCHQWWCKLYSGSWDPLAKLPHSMKMKQERFLIFVLKK
jgi:hypothetical protein